MYVQTQTLSDSAVGLNQTPDTKRIDIIENNV